MMTLQILLILIIQIKTRLRINYMIMAQAVFHHILNHHESWLFFLKVIHIIFIYYNMGYNYLYNGHFCL